MSKLQGSKTDGNRLFLSYLARNTSLAANSARFLRASSAEFAGDEETRRAAFLANGRAKLPLSRLFPGTTFAVDGGAMELGS